MWVERFDSHRAVMACVSSNNLTLQSIRHRSDQSQFNIEINKRKSYEGSGMLICSGDAHCRFTNKRFWYIIIIFDERKHMLRANFERIKKKLRTWRPNPKFPPKWSHAANREKNIIHILSPAVLFSNSVAFFSPRPLSERIWVFINKISNIPLSLTLSMFEIYLFFFNFFFSYSFGHFAWIIAGLLLKGSRLLFFS